MEILVLIPFKCYFSFIILMFFCFLFFFLLTDPRHKRNPEVQTDETNSKTLKRLSLLKVRDDCDTSSIVSWP